MPRGKRNLSEKMLLPHPQGKVWESAGSAGSALLQVPWEVTGPSRTRKTRYVRMGQLSQCKSGTAYWLVPWAVGEPPKKCLCVSCETKNNCCSPHMVLSQSQELNSVTFLCSDLQGLVFKSTRICLLETKAYVWALHVARTNRQWGTYRIWFGSIDLDLPRTI